MHLCLKSIGLANEDFLKAKIATDALVEEDPSFRYGNQSAVFLRNIAVETEIDLLLSKLKSLSSVKNRKRIEQLFAKHDEKSSKDGSNIDKHCKKSVNLS